jgi:hypothetical protein
VNFSVPNSDGLPSQNPKRGTATATVLDAPLTSATGAGGLTATEGASRSFDLGSFVDTNPPGAATDFSASINWGDGTPPSAGSVAANAAGGFDVTGNHDFASASTRTVTVTVTDVGGQSTQFTTQVVVHDAPLTAHAASGLTATEGILRGLTLATFTDADPGGSVSDYSATIHRGDGSTSAGTVAALPSGGFSVSAAHAYSEEGSWTATVTIDDVGGATATVTPTIAVADAPLTVRPVGLAGVAGHVISGTVATFTDADPAGALHDYAATISWGDGTASSAGSIAPNPAGGFTVSGSHTYARAGSYHATVTVADIGGASASGADAIAVAPAVRGAVAATLEWSFAFTTKFTRITSLAVNGAPAGGKVILQCSGRGCPYRMRTVQVNHRRMVNLAGPFRKHRLKPRTRLTVEIMQSGLIGKYFRFTIRSGRVPAIVTSCLAPGGSKPGVGCQGG